jgi:hypothetical protein
MIDFVSLSQNPVLIAGVTFVLLLVIVAGFVLRAIMVGQRRSLARLNDIAATTSHLSDSLVRVSLNLESVAGRLKNLEAQYIEFSDNYEQSKVELARLAQNIGGESQLTKAIDLARSGAGAAEITLATGIAEDEAQAIVKFHGSPKR